MDYRYNQYNQPHNRTRHAGIRWLLWLVPLMLACCVAAVLIAPAIPGLVLRLAGFKPEGNVETFWTEQAQILPSPLPVIGFPAAPPVGATVDPAASGPLATVTPLVINPAGNSGDAGTGGAVPGGSEYTQWFQTVNTPPTVSVVTAGGRTFSIDGGTTYTQTVWVGQATDGYPLGIIEYQESALDGICQAWLSGCATDQFRVTGVDFHPGGVAVYGSAGIAGLSQNAGIILTVGADGKSLVAAGVVLNGQVYGVPTTGEIADFVRQIVSDANQALQQMRVQANGYNLSLVQVRFTENSLLLVLR